MNKNLVKIGNRLKYADLLCNAIDTEYAGFRLQSADGEGEAIDDDRIENIWSMFYQVCGAITDALAAMKELEEGCNVVREIVQSMRNSEAQKQAGEV